MYLRDTFGRIADDLRISVTDRCNFRCVYCMPAAGLPWLARDDVLSFEEIVRVTRILVDQCGVRTIRLTGGEPLVRKGIEDLTGMIAGIDGDLDIAMTTNGILLEEKAAALRSAGLKRLNVSLDTLHSDRFKELARRDALDRVLRGLTAARLAGFDPIKLNMVVMRGINDDEIVDFARLTLNHPWHLRFIELMPVGGLRELTADHIVPSEEVLERVAVLGALEAGGGPPRGNGPAAYYHFAGAPGSIGVITPMTHTYCGSCNRVRLTADGRLRTCLFGDHEVDLRTPLRADEMLEPYFRRALAEKPKEHALLQLRVGGLRALSEVGG